MHLRSLVRARRREAGLSLIEALVAMTVAAVVVGLTATAFESSVTRRHLEGTAAQLETDIHFARSLAAAHQQSLRISFAAHPGGSCYVLHRGPAAHCSCDTTGEPVCQGPATVLRTVHQDQASPVRVMSNVRSIVFDPVKGTSTPTGTIRIVASDGKALHQVVNLMGRVRSCTPRPGLAGYPPC